MPTTASDSILEDRSAVPLTEIEFLKTPAALLIATIGVASFHLAYEFPVLAFLMGVFVFCIFRLAWVRTTRIAFYLGLVIGLSIYGPQLWFFVGIFKSAAVALWLIEAVWIALFLLLSRLCLKQWPRTVAIFVMPILWTGLEYFRSELYYLRFAWVSVGFAFSGAPRLLWPGVYGVGFFLMLAVAVLHLFRPRIRGLAGLLCLLILAAAANIPKSALPANTSEGNGPFVVGIQLEKVTESMVRLALDAAIARYPQADLLVLSEYTFFEPPPESIIVWCRDHHKYLIVGGTEPLTPDSDAYHNTAFVIGPDGRIVFQQGKSVPIQFFSDGLPADAQRVWDSPWGKIGICICYDLSYSRVIDRLVSQGAGALIVPTMDLNSWGRREHELHARVGPTRAAEYRIPVVRVCSSGISQIISSSGIVTASAPFPGQGEMVAGRLSVEHRTRWPIDRTLAPVCVFLSAVTGAWLTLNALRLWWMKRRLKSV